MKHLMQIFHGLVFGTPQMQPQPGKDQVANAAGGYVYALDNWARVDRFLVLGSEGGTYYASEAKLTRDNAQHLASMVKADGAAVVRRIIDISIAGRAPKQDAAIFALAMCAGWGDDDARRLALTDGLHKVCRTASHLLQFAAYIEQFRGWGRGLRGAIAAWFNDKPLDELAYQAVKYQRRYEWATGDLLRLAHPATDVDARHQLYRWMLGKPATLGNGAPHDDRLRLLWAVDRAKTMRSSSADEMAAFVLAHKLPREAVPTEWLREPDVWAALLEDMPMTALIRNLATMTRIGLITPRGAATEKVIAQLDDVECLRKARVHPIAVLAALETYRSGHGVRGSNTWKPVDAIVDALDRAFYAAFGNVRPAGRRVLIGLDVSGSMTYGAVAGVPGLTPRVASCAMSMVQVATEDRVAVMAFSDQFVPFAIGRGGKLETVIARAEKLPFSGTDCSLPMLYAIEKRLEVDAFVVYTDNETWFGAIHPDEALRKYRAASGIPAKLIVVGMTATGFTIADPNDGGMLDVVGFDTATPNLIADFVRGEAAWKEGT